MLLSSVTLSINTQKITWHKISFLPGALSWSWSSLTFHATQPVTRLASLKSRVGFPVRPTQRSLVLSVVLCSAGVLREPAPRDGGRVGAARPVRPPPPRARRARRRPHPLPRLAHLALTTQWRNIHLYTCRAGSKSAMNSPTLSENGTSVLIFR